MKKFCEYQWKCKEDTYETWTCTAHLEEGRAFQCPMKDMVDAKTAPGRCEDAEPVKCPDGCLGIEDEKKDRIRRQGA